MKQLSFREISSAGLESRLGDRHYASKDTSRKRLGGRIYDRLGGRIYGRLYARLGNRLHKKVREL